MRYGRDLLRNRSISYLIDPLTKRLGLKTYDGHFLISDLPSSTQTKVQNLFRGPIRQDSSLVSVNDKTDSWELIIEILKAKPKSLFAQQESENLYD